MTRDERIQALLEARPGEEWHLDDQGIRWLTPGKEAPTDSELVAALARVKARPKVDELSELRAAIARQQQFIDALTAEAAKKLSG